MECEIMANPEELFPSLVLAQLHGKSCEITYRQDGEEKEIHFYPHHLYTINELMTCIGRSDEYPGTIRIQVELNVPVLTLPD